jgi:catechol 2,3-dioxygenase-like lactoylglutathione lyase family enzyme
MSRVTEIRYVGYGVKDFDTERAFYANDWGLVEVQSTADMAWFKTHGHDEHHVVRLHKAAQNCVEVIALATETRADVDALQAKVAEAGCRIVHEARELDAPGGGYGFRFFSPDGLPFEVSAEVNRLDKRAMERWEGMPVQISHIVLHSPDHKAAAKFFCDVLGFRVSDWLGDFMVFLRCNSVHHRIALLPGPPCLNHVAYDMLTVDDVPRHQPAAAARDGHPLGARPPHGGRQHLLLFLHARRLRGRVHQRDGNGRFRDARGQGA